MGLVGFSPKLSSFLLPSQMINADCAFNTLLNRQQIVSNRGRISIKAFLWKINSSDVFGGEKTKSPNKEVHNDTAAF